MNELDAVVQGYSKGGRGIPYCHQWLAHNFNTFSLGGGQATKSHVGHEKNTNKHKQGHDGNRNRTHNHNRRQSATSTQMQALFFQPWRATRPLCRCKAVAAVLFLGRGGCLSSGSTGRHPRPHVLDISRTSLGEAISPGATDTTRTRKVAIRTTMSH